ncbi:hypothetical protein [Vacuolonema iberomarrocanum]|uniref:hypothetical protein n=1 Tax=Vacuolonema iberomarrocanum TaxID=3454632 RepID=UPI0019FCE1D9|nr:hypothetical protein [filamentous cyanobacterium LEGE 07170]
MITLTTDEIETYRAQFADNSAVLRTLDVIEDCEGNLEDAAIDLALKVGQEPTESERWLEGFAKRWRVQLCQLHLRRHVQEGRMGDAMSVLVEMTNLPISLAIALLIYAQKTGLEEFCQPLNEKL